MTDDTNRKEERTEASAAVRLAAWMKGGKGRNLIIAAGIVGILLILLAEYWPKQTAASSAKTTAEAFVAQTESKLAEVIGNIEGAGECRIMVTLENGVEYVYASQEKINTDRVEDTSKLSQRDDKEKSIIVVDTQDGRQGLLVTEIQPTVKGVVVVCQGGDQPLVQQRVIDAVTTALNIASTRVCVTKLS